MVIASETSGIDFEAQVAVIAGDVPMGASPEEALDGVRLLMLANDVCLRRLMAADEAAGPGSLCSPAVHRLQPGRHHAR